MSQSPRRTSQWCSEYGNDGYGNDDDDADEDEEDSDDDDDDNDDDLSNGEACKAISAFSGCDTSKQKQ